MSHTDPVNTAVCIYCLTDSKSSRFTREHIIPRCVGGTLFVDDLVCERCNSLLGSEVDCQILKLPEILTAMDKLCIPYDRDGVLRTSYNSQLVSETGRLRAAHASGAFRLITQNLQDGSLVTPGHEVPIDALRRMLARDCRLGDMNLTEDAIAGLLGDLTGRFANSKEDEEVECAELGLRLVKRSAALRGEASPKSAAAINRLVGKIAFEWLFSCLGKLFVESAPWAVDLRNVVCGSENLTPLHFFRSQPVDSTIRKTHSVYVYLTDSFTKVAVAFFGGIEFTLIAPFLPIAALKPFRSATKTYDAIGIAFEQDLSEPAKRFFALRGDGSSRFLGNL